VIRWGVVGVGRAGAARVHALRADPRASIVGGVRGALDELQVPGFASLEALFAAVDAVAICSPDGHHGEQVRRALDAGCHVVCEFPLAQDSATAAALFEHADRTGRVLHVEHIELLTPTAIWLLGRCRGRRLVRARLAFQRPTTSGRIAHDNLARFHRLWDAVGRPEVDGRHLRVGGAPVLLDLRHAPGEPRRFELDLHLDDGCVIRQRDRVLLEDDQQVPLPPSTGLFATDQLAASAAMLDGAAPYVARERIVGVLALADALHASRQSSKRS